ncbi:MAG: GNAT family N-acetyltransferase [Pseudomonadota bacterium]
MTATTIETPDFTLRAFEPEDADAVTSLISEPEVIRMIPTLPYPYVRTDAKAFIAEARNRPFCWAIATDRAIGGVAIGSELGYWLGRPYWGRGLVTQAATIAIDAFFAARDAAEIPSGHLQDNSASRRVLNKLGFVETGRRLVYSNCRRGEVERVDMRLLRADWERRAA